MALIPYTMRPGFILRRNAVSKGLLGPSMLWKVVALVVFGRGALKRVFGRSPQRLGTRRLGVGHVIMVATAAPLTRRQARRAGVSKASLEAQAWADIEAAQRAS